MDENRGIRVRRGNSAFLLAMCTCGIVGQPLLAAGTSIRSFDDSDYTPGEAVQVTVTVTPDTATQAWATEDQPPAGWAVSSISDNGVFDSVNGKVKWGLFFDNQGYPGGQAYALSYAATPPAGASGTQSFSGRSSFDGANVQTGGSSSLSPSSPPPPPPPPPPAKDTDNDGVADTVDNCKNVPNVSQADGDRDGVGDACDLCPGSSDKLDKDKDGIPDGCDNCPSAANAGQQDADGDGVGDACDVCLTGDDLVDADADGVANACDNCPAVANTEQADTDADSLGDACDVCPSDAGNDVEGDGVCGDTDNCPQTANPDQADADGDGIGDVCEEAADSGEPIPSPAGQENSDRRLSWCGLGVAEAMVIGLMCLLVPAWRRQRRPQDRC